MNTLAARSFQVSKEKVMHRETVLPPCASTDLLRDQGSSHVSLRRAPKIMKVLQLTAVEVVL